MRARSVELGRRSATATGAIVTDMEISRRLTAADCARRCTVALGGSCGSDASHQPTNRLLVPLSSDGERHEQNALFGAVQRFDEFGHSSIRRLDLTMEELGDDIVICCSNRWGLSVILRQRADKVAVRVRSLDVSYAPL